VRPSLFRRNLTLIALAISLATLAFTLLAIGLTDRLSIEAGSSVLLKTAALAANDSRLATPAANQARPSAEEPRLSQILAEIARLTGYRVTVIRMDGTVLADSSADPASMENHGSRPEVAKALAGQPSTAVRKSSTTQSRMLYAAVPMGNPESGVLRLAMSLPPTFGRLAEAQWIFILSLFFVAALSLIISVAISRQIALPINYIIDKAEAYAKGSPPPPPRRASLPVELSLLNESLDGMVEKIKRRTTDAEELGKRNASILEAAGEGIIALDASLRIVEANSAAASLFGTSRKEMTGKTVLEALDSREVAEIFKESFDSSKELFRDLRLIRNGDRHIKVHTTVPVEGRGSGIVAVFSDITELKRLEAVRKDFVANVSHELRTPIQIIRGYAEILLGEENNFDAMKKYLGLIDKNAQRMDRIVADLLSLARLENDPLSWLTVEFCPLRSTIEDAIAAVQLRAAAKRMAITLACPESLSCIANSGLIEQAIVNLLDNAVNYSPEGSSVSVSAESLGDRVEIRIADKGIGIPPADLAHIFERFYRVDKSRSKQTGGTGLGLAIVRHIASIHGGEVRAESYRGEGSKFTISLPSQGPANIKPSSLD